MLIQFPVMKCSGNAVYYAQIIHLSTPKNKSMIFLIVASNFFNAKIIFSIDIRYVA